MLVLIVGLLLGLVFLLGGLTAAADRLRSGLRSMRLRRHGTTITAEVLKSTKRSDEGRGKGVLVTGHWEWGSNSYRKQFTVSDRWWMANGGLTIPVRVDPDRPQRAAVDVSSRSPVWTLLIAAAFIVMAVVGVVFLFQSAITACDSAELDILKPLCESVRIPT
jgi:Protein of unknown function (DUF3592)